MYINNRCNESNQYKGESKTRKKKVNKNVHGKGNSIKMIDTYRNIYKTEKYIEMNKLINKKMRKGL